VRRPDLKEFRRNVAQMMQGAADAAKLPQKAQDYHTGQLDGWKQVLELLDAEGV
jgi:hypothetical protein